LAEDDAHVLAHPCPNMLPYCQADVDSCVQMALYCQKPQTVNRFLVA